MLNIIFHPDVKDEIKAAYKWYQNQAAGLGNDFLSELEMSFQIITEFPDSWSNFQKGFKCYRLPRFPFSVIYRRSAENIFVVAVMHNRRKPGYWHHRES